ncbi:POK10 protein, partial [Pelecanoides urinatrix]|nr:POK10 protein [Pelecanoides urinatrix]
VHHITGIAHNATGQAIIERAHLILKTLLAKQKKGEIGSSPQMRLQKVLFTLNFLTLSGERELSPVLIHFSTL